MRDIFCVVTKNQKHSYNSNQDGHAKVVSPSFFVSANQTFNNSQETQEAINDTTILKRGSRIS